MCLRFIQCGCVVHVCKVAMLMPFTGHANDFENDFVRGFCTNVMSRASADMNMAVWKWGGCFAQVR